MIHIVVAIKDRAADAFNRPFFTTTTGQAIRAFQDEVNRAAADNTMYHHSDDFDLYVVGFFNDQTGKFDAEPDMPRQIAIGKNCKLETTGKPSS